MTGTLHVVGLGPGDGAMMTPDAQAAIARATALYGYAPYLDRLALAPGQRAIASDNREELDRAREALGTAAAGEAVCMVSGGDPGVFAMASAVCEAIESDAPRWDGIELVVVPGLTAMLAVAARAGAPLGNDFCAISLSDNLKPWTVIEARLRAAAGAGFAMAFYNPISKARPWQLGSAFNILREILDSEIPVVFGRAAGRPDAAMRIVSLGEARPEMADMATCVIVGAPTTRIITRAGQPPLVYTPRFVRDDG
ncbi:precorrin-3B C(17)-methyltransferase [Pelagibacterium montanilacus]|uniref:precorrin-3B C(17)-methyltransferase n=1 Tax=Pelagibacterium montanilacus TaxID=2185280 RepID=UPI000F8F22C9|nr:precorrin-3B C(17)-methyltransferase [Pelagibacterium montanilacus]